ncbi:MAG: hypothetical protein ACI8PZ_007384 [Myxococcota bacterium]|jgi:hypothetical protein
MSWLRSLAAAVLAMPAIASAAPLSMCVYDPGGAAGDAFQAAKKYQTAALDWGAQLELRPYTSESVAANDFRNGKCDAALLTGVRSQQFSKAAYSIESMGVLPNYDALKASLGTLAKEAASSLMVSGDYEVAGVFPAGAVYLYINDRSRVDLAALAGKKVCTLDFDPSAKFMVEHIGAQVVPADVGTFASLFNNKSCDVAYAPATAYGPLELYKGLGDDGGIVKFPLSQLTLQVLIRSSSLPSGFGQASRAWAAGQFDSVLELTTKAEADVDPKYWVTIPAADSTKYVAMFKDVRGQLVSQGVYDPTVVKLLEAIAAKYPGP